MGPADSAPLIINYTPPSRVPLILPWITLLGLLLLRINHSRVAWLPIVPYALVVAIQAASGKLPQFMDSNGFQVISTMIKLFAFALSAAWLLLPYLAASHRFIAFLKLLGVFWVATAFAFIGEKITGGFDLGETFAISISVSLLCFAGALALLISGWACRKRFSWVHLYLWITAASVAAAVLTIGFVLVMMALSGGPVDFGEMLIALGATALTVAGPLWIFLLISGASEFHGQRLKNWLRAAPEAPPVKREEHQPATAG